MDKRIETLATLIRHGVEALYEGDGDIHTLRATMENLDRLVAIATKPNQGDPS
jgi:hypothetical protein